MIMDIEDLQRCLFKNIKRVFFNFFFFRHRWNFATSNPSPRQNFNILIYIYREEVFQMDNVQIDTWK